MTETRTITGRLRWAIEQLPHDGRRRGVRLFQRRMADRAKAVKGLDGVSLSSVQTYLDSRNPVTPSITFLREAAQVLGVRPAWLSHGDGPARDSDSFVEQSLKRTTADAATRLLAAALPGSPCASTPAELARVRDPALPYWLAPLAQLDLRLWVGEFDADSDESVLNRHEAIGQALRAPMEALGVDQTRMHREEPVAYGNYITAVIPGLFILADERNRQVREKARARLIEEEDADERERQERELATARAAVKGGDDAQEA